MFNLKILACKAQKYIFLGSHARIFKLIKKIKVVFDFFNGGTPKIGPILGVSSLTHFHCKSIWIWIISYSFSHAQGQRRLLEVAVMSSIVSDWQSQVLPLPTNSKQQCYVWVFSHLGFCCDCWFFFFFFLGFYGKLPGMVKERMIK